MIRTRIAGMAAVCALLAAPAAADVTVKQKMGSKGMGGRGMPGPMSGETVQYIKGAKMRTDHSGGGSPTSTIADAASQQMIVLDHAKREATVTDTSQLAQQLAMVGMGEIKASVTPTTETRRVAGATCTVHNLDVRVPMQIAGETIAVVLAGPVCAAKGGPGAADYAAFFEAAAAKGLFFGDPAMARAQPGMAKAMAEMSRQMASAGVPYASEIDLRFEGSGAMATIMAKMGGTTMTTEVLSISTDPIDDAMFAVPEGYTQRKQ